MNQPDDNPLGAPEMSNATLLDFWKWAFSDLCDDDLKGVFAEWLVHRLLDIPSRRRVSWANSDVVTTQGVRLEVKATSYWQSWKVINQHGQPYAEPLRKVLEDNSNIRFSGLMARDATGTGDLSTTPMYKSQLYVFAFQHEKNISRWNAMDMTQWEFCVIRAEELAKIAGRTVVLKKLRPTYGPLDASEFVARANALVKQVALENAA